VSCPEEVNLACVFESIFSMITRLGVLAKQSGIAEALCRDIADRTIGAAARTDGKSRWCDKSLGSAHHADLLHRVYPNARFICLFRECTDTMASVIEACVWGYNAFGVEPYIRATPDNVIFALASWWADITEALLATLRAYPSLAIRLHYEDVVTDTRHTIQQLLENLELPWSEMCVDPAHVFAEAALFDDPGGDYKILYAKDFSHQSIGRGWTIPITSAIPRELTERINSLNAALGYPEIDTNLEEIVTAKRGRSSSLMPQQESSDVASVDDLFAQHARTEAITLTTRRSRMVKVAFVDGHKPWFVNLETKTAADAGDLATCTVLTDSHTLLSIANGSLNAGVALRQGRLRVASEVLETGHDLLVYVNEFISVITQKRQNGRGRPPRPSAE